MTLNPKTEVKVGARPPRAGREIPWVRDRAVRQLRTAQRGPRRPGRAGSPIPIFEFASVFGFRPADFRGLTLLLALLFCAASARGDLCVERQLIDSNRVRTVVLRIQGDKMRMDQPEEGFSVLVNFKTRDSFTLFTNKTFLNKFGTEAHWEIEEELKLTHGTNDMDAPPAPATDTGKSEVVNGYPTRIYEWSGAHGMKQTLWVATNYPAYAAMRAELFKVDRFNDGGLHRNAQPPLSPLPGMVVKSVTIVPNLTITNLLISARSAPLDATLFEVPRDYKRWERPEQKL